VEIHASIDVTGAVFPFLPGVHQKDLVSMGSVQSPERIHIHELITAPLRLLTNLGHARWLNRSRPLEESNDTKGKRHGDCRQYERSN